MTNKEYLSLKKGNFVLRKKDGKSICFMCECVGLRPPVKLVKLINYDDIYGDVVTFWLKVKRFVDTYSIQQTGLNNDK